MKIKNKKILSSRGCFSFSSILQAKYEKMQKNIEKFGSDPKNRRIVSDRPPRIEVCASLTHLTDRPTSLCPQINSMFLYCTMELSIIKHLWSIK